MNSVHFIGIEATMKALEKFDHQQWGLFQGKQPIVCGDNLESLEDWLEMFDGSGTTAQFTIRLYDVPGPYVWSTPYLCSFNFKLNDPYAGAGIAGYGSKLADRVAALEKGGNDKEEDWGDVIMGWFKDPEQLDIIVGAVQKIFGKQQLPMQQSMGSTGVTLPSVSAEQKLERLSIALDTLEKKDPKLIEHLEKLATLDELTFQLVVSKLDAI